MNKPNSPPLPTSTVDGESELPSAIMTESDEEIDFPKQNDVELALTMAVNFQDNASMIACYEIL